MNLKDERNQQMKDWGESSRVPAETSGILSRMSRWWGQPGGRTPTGPLDLGRIIPREAVAPDSVATTAPKGEPVKQGRAAEDGGAEQLQAELAQSRSAAELARAQCDELEKQAAVLRNSISALERQLREARESAASRLSVLAGERDQAEADRLISDAQAQSNANALKALRARNRQLEQELIAASAPQGGPGESPGSAAATRIEMQAEVHRLREERATAAAQIRQLEAELVATRQQMAQEKTQAARSRMQRLESRWDELKARLLPRERELQELRQEAAQSRGRVEELEAALADQGDPRVLHLGEDSEPEPRPVFSSYSPAPAADAVEALYHQTMAPLTVLLASADLLLMDPGLGADLRQSAEEVKRQGQILLEIVRSFTLVADSRQVS